MNIKQKPADRIANVIYEVFRSPNESDRNFEPANVVDGLFAVARAIAYLADAIKEQKDSAIPPS